MEEVVACRKYGAEAEEEEESSEHESNTESDHAEASRESSSTDEGLMVKSKKQKEKLRKKRRRRDGAASERIVRREQQSVEEKREARLRELLEAEPELNTLPEDVICPVCLDLLHEPFQVEPCGHIFCEPCLRRLGQKNPMNCSCPLCRWLFHSPISWQMFLSGQRLAFASTWRPPLERSGRSTSSFT